MNVKVNKDLCIGCGACTAIASDVFVFDDDGLAKAIVEVVPKEEEDNVQDAIESCPTSAIENEEK